MAIMVYFHWILHTPMHPEAQTAILNPGLSLDNLLLFILCTPVQVYIPSLSNPPLKLLVFVGIRWAILLRAELEGAEARDGEHGCFNCFGDVDRLYILCVGAADRVGAVLAVQSDDLLRCTTHAHGLRFARPLAGTYRQGLLIQ
jgi:hypothetical protein